LHHRGSYHRLSCSAVICDHTPFESRINMDIDFLHFTFTFVS
ncbi:hypothetical protein T01_1270, partial [Trichinella spiralis]